MSLIIIMGIDSANKEFHATHRYFALRMFKIIFSYRCEMGTRIEVDDCIKATEIIISNANEKGAYYINSIMEHVRPMSQNTAGLHCNLENQVKMNKKWYNLFGNINTQNPKICKMNWTKRIDTNFIKICLLVKGIDMTNHLKSK